MLLGTEFLVSSKKTTIASRFPANPEKRLLWCQRLNLESAEHQKKFIYVCSQHFVEDSFYTSPSGLQCIKEDALPRLTR